jgi:putative transposase
MNSLKSLSSCKFLLQYHFIFVCKYRRKVLNPIRNDVLSIMESISKKYDFEIHTQEIDQDHIHLLIETIPRISPSQICRVLKQESTIFLWKNHSNYLSKFYWKEQTLWSDGYFCSTIGNVSEETLKHYIETQGS